MLAAAALVVLAEAAATAKVPAREATTRSKSTRNAGAMVSLRAELAVDRRAVSYNPPP